MKALIIGAGTYGEVYLFYLKEAGYEIVCFLDDNKDLWGSEVHGIPVQGPITSLESINTIDVEAVFCPIGNNSLRVEFLAKAEQLGFKTPCFIHSTAVIPSNLEIGRGVYILPGSIIMPYVKLDDYVMISMGAKVAHHSILKKGAFISTGVNFGANIIAKECAYVGIGATIMTGIQELGNECLIGAGSVVINNVPSKAIVAGVPAKIIKYK